MTHVILALAGVLLGLGLIAWLAHWDRPQAAPVPVRMVPRTVPPPASDTIPYEDGPLKFARVVPEPASEENPQ